MTEYGPDFPHEPYQYRHGRDSLQCYIRRADLNTPHDPNLLQFLQACYGGKNEQALALVKVQDKSDESLLLGLKLATRDDNAKLVQELIHDGVPLHDSVLIDAHTAAMAEVLVRSGLNLASLDISYSPLM